MAIQSKYTNAQVETLITEIFTVFDKQKAPADLRLMILGNCVTNILQTSINDKARAQVTEQFTKALQQSVKHK